VLPADQSMMTRTAESAFDTHLRLDEAIDDTLSDLIANTETSAMATMQKIRELYDSATRVVGVLNGTGPRQSGLGADVVAIISNLGDVGAFIADLPVRMKRDLENAQTVAKAMMEISTLVETVRSISVQSHILAVNTSIQASHAGNAGAAFRVIATEMRKLAADAKSVATSMVGGLSRAHHMVHDGMTASISQSTDELEKVAGTSASILLLREKLEDMSRQHQTQLATAASHNEKLAQDIAAALGHIQYQDIVRQSIDRIRSTIGQRNACVQAVLDASNGETFGGLPQQLELILDNYVSIESNHTRAAQHQADSDQRKVELF
jgi:methyl-accepting chemotaxis protein